MQYYLKEGVYLIKFRKLLPVIIVILFAVVIVDVTIRELKRENDNLIKEKVKIENEYEKKEEELLDKIENLKKKKNGLEEKLEAKKKKKTRVASTRHTKADVLLSSNNTCIVEMKKIFPKHLWRTGAAVMLAESGARPNAIGGPNYNGTYDYGCWQINDTKRALDPKVGTDIAWYKYGHSKWYPWVAWKNGKHKRFL